MVAAVKLKLLALHRNRIGFLDVKNIKQGKYIKLDKIFTIIIITRFFIKKRP